MAELTPPDDLRTRLAEAEGLRRNGPASDGRGWYRNEADREECFAVADAVLAVLGDYRDTVLDGAAQAIEADGADIGHRPIYHGRAAAIVRRLAATGPEPGSAVTVPLETLIADLSAADPDFRASVERAERELAATGPAVPPSATETAGQAPEVPDA